MNVMTEPTMPTIEATPNLPVAHVDNVNVKNAAKSQKTGSPNQTKPRRPTVTLNIAQSALKTPAKAMSIALKYAFFGICLNPW
jgi:hypothetical protein